MWTPTHVIVTVLRARNLLDKGKGGNDAYCMIGMGKEKFLTSVRNKTLSPVWDEQAEFELNERADLKLTVYHKSSIIDEFVGRVVLNVSDLISDSNQSFTKWLKLQAKPEKSDNKKPDKDRGEIEVRIEFVIRPKTGSVMDLSYKNKEKSMSLKNLKDKSVNIKNSLGDKFKILQKPRKPKFTGENQLAEQANRMNNGSKLDFLDGDDLGSLTSSYSSINGSTFSRFEDAKPANSMSRFNPTRSSFMSRNSSRMDNDSINNDLNNNNEEDASVNSSELQDNDSSQFNRQNSFRKSSIRRGSKRSQLSTLQNAKNESDPNLAAQNVAADGTSKIHIAPLPPFLSGNPFGNEEDEQNKLQQQQRSYQVLNSIIFEESPAIPQPQPPPPSANTKSKSHHNKKEAPKIIDQAQNQADSFASIFTASLASEPHFSEPHVHHSNLIRTESNDGHQYSTPKSSQVISNSNPFLSDNNTIPHNDTNNNLLKSPTIKVKNSDANSNFFKIDSLIVSTGDNDDDDKSQMSHESHRSKKNSDVSPKSLSSIHSSMTTMVKSEPANAAVAAKNINNNNIKSNSYFNNSSSNNPNDDEDDHIDWASSEDDEIVKQEVESFERNQALNSSQLVESSVIKKQEKEGEDNLVKNTGSTSQINNNNNNNNNNSNSANNSNKPKNLNKLLETSSWNQSDHLQTSAVPKITDKSALSKNFPLTSSFQIDLDPFSSSSSSSSLTSIDKIPSESLKFDPFLDFFNAKMSSETTKSTEKVEPVVSINQNGFDTDFSNALEFKSVTDERPKISEIKLPGEKDDEDNQNPEEINDISWNKESGVVLETLREEESSSKIEEEEEDEAQKSLRKEEVAENNPSESSDDEYSVPPLPSKSKRLSQVSLGEKQHQIDIKDPFLNGATSFQVPSFGDENDENEQNNDKDDFDDAFKNFSNSQLKPRDSVLADDMADLQENLGEMRNFASFIDNNNNDMDLAMRKGDATLSTIGLRVREQQNHNDSDEDEFENNTNTNNNERENENLVTSQSLKGNVSTASVSIINAESETNNEKSSPFKPNTILRQSERKRLIPTEDLTSDLNSETDFNTNSFSNGNNRNGSKNFSRSSMKIDLKENNKSKISEYSLDDEIKTPDFDSHYGFHQNEPYDSKLNTSDKSDDTNPNGKGTNNGLPDLINQKESSDKARKYLEGLDGVKFNEIQVPDSLKKQLEYFDRDELLQLIAYQKKYLDFKESRIKDLESYIDNLIVKIIETEPLILMNASSVLNKPRNII